MNKVRVELLVARRVTDVNGRDAGRIMSIHADREGSECFVKEYWLGTAALLSRLGITTARLVGLPISIEPRRVPWELMDLSDPDNPRLKCKIEELPNEKKDEG